MEDMPALSLGEWTTLKAVAKGSRAALIEPHVDKLLTHGLLERIGRACVLTNRGRLAIALSGRANG